MPEVTVIINCFNGSQYLREAIDSVYAQTFQDWEIVFWDNCSTDDTPAIAMSYDRRLRYFRTESTIPFGHARQQALQESHGKYVALLDADDLWFPSKLERQLPLFYRDSGIGMVFSDSIFFNSGGDQYSLFQLVRPKRGYIFGDLLTRNFISTETIIYRQSAIESLGDFFEPSLDLVVDYDMTLKISHQWHGDYVDTALSKWRMHPQSQSNQKRSQFLDELEILVEALLRRHPDIADTSAAEIAAYRKSLVYSHGIDMWRRGDRKAARRYLGGQLNNKRALLTYLLTWVAPYAVFNEAKDSYRKIFLAKRPRQ